MKVLIKHGQVWIIRSNAAFISSSIKGIASSIDKTQYCLSDLILLEKMPSIELFDFKSSDLFVSSAVSQVSTFRLLLMLYQISYALILVEEIFEINMINEDDLWSYFFIKLVARKYDEFFENLQSSNPILCKIYNNEKISQQDLHELEKVIFEDLGSKEDYQKYYGNKPTTILIREINGLEKEAVEKAFAEFMHKYNLNRNQTEFLRALMQYLEKNGHMDLAQFQKEPFSSIGSISQIFSEDRKQFLDLVAIVKAINEVVQVA